MHVTKVNLFKGSINPTALNILMDDSGSMREHHEKQTVTRAINEIMVPALKGAHKKNVDLLRVSLGSFSTGKIQSLTRSPGYHSVDELLRNPVTNDRFGRSGLNNATDLYKSIIGGIDSAVSAALQMKSQAGCSNVTAQLVMVTDGKNYSNDPTTPQDVRRAIEKVGPLSDYRVSLRIHFAYFKTSEGLSESEFRNITQQCGLPHKNCHFWGYHQSTFKAQQKAFRHLLGILSKLTAEIEEL